MVLAILAQGLPLMPNHLRRLAVLLGANPVDLQMVASVIRQDRYLTSRLFRWSEAFRAGQAKRVQRIEEATILLGTERLKNLIFAHSLVLLTGDRLRRTDLETFSTHSLATASLGETAARAVGYDDSERVYRAGLMHDSGKLPLLMIAAGDAVAGEWSRTDDANSLRLERDYFGFDHCQVGRGLGVSWNLDPGLVEVLEWHHEPEKARFDPDLVGIVAAADHFLGTAGASRRPSAFPIDGVYRACFPRLSNEELKELVSLFGREHARLRPQTRLWREELEALIPSQAGRGNE